MEELQTKLKEYHSSFDVLDHITTSKEGVKKIKDKLKLEMKQEEYDTDMEVYRAWNLISFLSFILKDFDEAEKFNKKVLEKDADNMVALSNKAWFSIKKFDHDQSINDVCKKLEGLKKKTLPSLVAEAEIAFTYSRLGVKMYGKAELSYKRVIDKCDKSTGEEIQDINKIPTDYICVWVFGYALVQNRLLNFGNTMDEKAMDLSPEKYKCLIELYSRIIRLKDSSNCVLRYKARSFVDLGLLTNIIQKLFPDVVSMIRQNELNLLEETEEYFTTALNTFPDDVYVLERSGKYFRYARQIDKSIEMLEKAVKIKGSSFAYHHLALSLRRKLDLSVGNVVNTPQRSHGKSSTQRPAVNHVKSPLKPKPIDYEANKDTADAIIRYLDKSVEISTNTGAMLDKGLFYRQLGKHSEALDTFKTLIKNEERATSRVDIAISYEQAGLCIRALLEKSLEKDQHEKMENEMKMYLKSSIEISCNIVANIPCLENCWKSAPTLHAILLGEASTRENKEDLLFLYNKMQRHKEALQVLDELGKIAETEEENIQIIQEKAQKYLILGRFDDAVITLNMLGLLPNGLENMDKTCREVYIEACIDALKKGHDDIARGRIKNALEIGKRNTTNVTSSSRNGDSLEVEYDLFILCSIDDDDKGKQLLNIMNRVGLNTTLNIDRQRPGTSVLAGMTDGMKKSKHFMIVFDFDADDESVANQMQHLTERLQAIVEERKRGTSRVIVIKPIGCVKVPDMFLGYKTIDMELQLVTDDFTENQSMCASVKEILEFLV